MVSMEDLILRSTNPFDSLRSINFWHRQKDPEPMVESIHQDAMAALEGALDQVMRDHYTRTILLDGDSGSGKTYLLGRLKRALNHKAFFVYIPPFPQNDYIWRHILRYTVDSLVQVPTGQKYSQLLLWLKGVLLSVKQRSLRDRVKENILDLLQTDRQQFIKRLKDIYKQMGPDSIYNADKFFGILHDLTDPKLYPLACEWLRADDLGEESLEALGLKSSIDTEQAAREILANFGRVAIKTQPIVLCFDQLESIARTATGGLDLQSLFNVNTKIHDEDKNFLVVISILTNTWEQYRGRIDQSHRARVDREIPLRLINLEQAESLWASRLHHLYRQAQPQPSSVIYPLDRHDLSQSCPGGRTNPRDVLRLGRDMFQAYKEWLMQEVEANQFKPLSEAAESAPAALIEQPPVQSMPAERSVPLRPQPSPDHELLATFKLRWQDELSKVEDSITRIRYFTSLELIEMLKEALTALQIPDLAAPLLERTKYSGYSFSYGTPDQAAGRIGIGRIGIVWTEEQGMDTFFRIMEACQRTLDSGPQLQQLCLIRAEGLGKPQLKGHQLYRQIFVAPHRHIVPDLASVQAIAAYYNLVKDAREGDLVLGSQTAGLKILQTLAQESGIFNDCSLLQALNVISVALNPSDLSTSIPNPPFPTDNLPNYTNSRLPHQVEDYLLSLVRTHPVIGLQTLVHNTLTQFPQTDIQFVDERIHHLCQSQQIQVLNPTATAEAQLVCRGTASS
jgi:GTPase SAR1 family protein